MHKTPFLILASVLAVSTCGTKIDQPVDRGIDIKNLENLTKTPGIWVDGDGCEHWAIDDGIEGYQMNRLDRCGKPICGLRPSVTLYGPDGRGSPIADPIRPGRHIHRSSHVARSPSARHLRSGGRQPLSRPPTRPTM